VLPFGLLAVRVSFSASVELLFGYRRNILSHGIIDWLDVVAKEACGSAARAGFTAVTF
jgi:hypothetical protein